MSSGPEAGSPRGENWRAVELLQDEMYKPPAAQPGQPDNENVVFDLAGLSDGGIAVRDGDGPIFVLDEEEAKAACGCPPGECIAAAMFDNDIFPTDDGI